MKFKRTFFLTAVVVSMGLLLGAGATSATEVEIDENGNAIRITNLEVTDETTGETSIYNVNFVYDRATRVYAFGFDFPDDETIILAREAVNNALNNTVPIPQRAGPHRDRQFFIGNKVEASSVVALGGENILGVWETCETDCISPLGLGGVAVLKPNARYTYADFTLTGEAAQPVTIGGTVTGLTGEGLILQNNGADDLAIEANDIDFEFATPLTPGESYNVTVLTDPAGQTCSIENGSGEVPDVNVTGVVVSCVDEPDDPGEEATILETLCSQDGTQVLCAAIRVAQVKCPRFARLLDRKRANLVVLAPPNEGFEVFLNLIPGTFKAWDVDSIARMLPGILEVNDMKIRDLCKLLRRHISKGERGEDPITLQELLQRGTITMLDGSEYPVAIGGGRGGGACINYEACIVEPDVHTQNGVIQYLHKVLERPPVEEPPPPPDPDPEQPPSSDEIDAWCSQMACAEDPELKAECIDFMNECLPQADKEGDREGCFATGMFKCTEREGLSGGDGIFD